ncbi:E3 ubiquitin/ISG15 ligase TRIM25-like [Chanos chanos]|uniref:E3 ubiquitin/ISG15 ligase TRIM25-like n=1 Tax=Chanos chanos TaxID=29144 RepID=A0A6J2W055_CHACN|nr:E3 ubiquitin/ISG15 ligase TRIM25-like [Chanos chanos]
MAQASISVTESQFRCSICLDILKDPVSTPCGHTYCMVCINSYWDKADTGPCSCPQCRETFSPRPVLRRNTVLAEVVEKLKLNEVLCTGAPEPYLGGVGDVACDFCPVENKLKAVKSCLACLVSFCEMHVAPHREVGTLRRHRLVDAIENLADRLCAQHRLGLQGGGFDSDAGDWSGDCLLCEADQEEAHHVDSQRARKQAQVQNSQRAVQSRIQNGERDLEELQQTLDSLKCSSSAVLEESEALFSELAQRLEKTRAEVQTRLLGREKAMLGRVEREMEELERELAELRKRDQEMNELLLTEDNAHFLQMAPLLCMLPIKGRRPRSVEVSTEGFSAARKALSHLRARIEELCREEVEKIGKAVGENSAHHLPGENQKAAAAAAAPKAFPLSAPALQPADQRLRSSFLRFYCHLTLDPDTAHPTLCLLDGSQGAHCGEEPQPYAPHPQRFDSVAQVLCKEGQFGSSYWEVEWRGGGWVDIGVTYKGIGRKGGGKPCLLGRNENSWRLRCTHAGYAAWHDNRKTTVAAPPCPRIGVFLERQKGALSFYSVSDSVTLLHTFSCLFSQPLYPAFRLDLDSTLLICQPEGPNGDSTL